MTSIDNVHKEDWIEIKHIGKMKPQDIGMSLSKLNHQLMDHICSFIEFKDINKLAQVNKSIQGSLKRLGLDKPKVQRISLSFGEPFESDKWNCSVECVFHKNDFSYQITKMELDNRMIIDSTELLNSINKFAEIENLQLSCVRLEDNVGWEDIVTKIGNKMTSIDNVHKEDWIEIKHIGKMKPQHIGRRVPTSNFAFNTSGSICVYYKQTVHDTMHSFTFVDLVNKVSFESKVVYVENEDILRVDGFYFSSENELVIIAVFEIMVIQMVYKIDFANHSRKLQETITHKFISRDVFEIYEFTFQPNKFVNFNGIDYILMIAQVFCDDYEDEIYRMYLVPMNPQDKDAPTTKEFLFRFKPNDEITATIREIVKPYEDFNEIANDQYYITSDCLVRTNKLCFLLKAVNENTNRDCYRLIGVYSEVDLTKLRDISQEEFRSKENLQLLFEKQEDAFQFIQAGDVNAAKLERHDLDIHFYHSDYNIGTVYMYKKKDNNNLHMTVINHMGASKTNVMDCELEASDESSRSDNKCDRFTLHPHGALLHFKIEDGSIRFRVLKNLKMNLKSLSLNKALFHKDTPIKHHPSYRLCFNRTKPIEYVIEKKMNLKRKRRH